MVYYSLEKNIRNYLEKMSLFFIVRKNKKGELEFEQIIILLIAVILIIVLLGGAYFLFFNKGGRIFESIKDIFRFGR
jgi:hypothetical protein